MFFLYLNFLVNKKWILSRGVQIQRYKIRDARAIIWLEKKPRYYGMDICNPVIGGVREKYLA